MTPRTIVLLGKSGSGKDTQIELLAKKLEPHLIVSTGEKFREIAELDSVAGRKINTILKEGGLPPDWFAEYLWQGELIYNLKGEEHIICGGTPRRLNEAKKWDEVITWLGRKLPEAVLVDIPDDEAVARIVKRARNKDDNEENVRKRLEWFRDNVVPVINYYEEEGRLQRVDGVGTVEEVFERIRAALNLE